MEMIEAARKITGHAVPAIITERRPAILPSPLPAVTKAKQELGWKRKYPEVEKIIETAWKFKNNLEQKEKQQVYSFEEGV